MGNNVNITPTFAVTLTNGDGDKIKEYRFHSFDKKAIADKFAELYMELRTREVEAELEYWKQDNKWAYIPMLTLEKRMDGVKQQIIKGQRVLYKHFDIDIFKQNSGIAA